MNQLIIEFDKTATHLSCFSLDDIRTIVSIDSKLPETGDDFVCDENITTYYILANTWLNQFPDNFERTKCNIIGMIRKRGLIPVISDCANAADSIIQNMDSPIPYLRQLSDCRSEENIKLILQLLRYPKRLSPVCMDGLSTSSLEKFLTRENKSKLVQRRPLSFFQREILERASEILAPLFSPMADDDILLPLRRFSNGATAGGSKTIAERVCETVSQIPSAFGSDYRWLAPCSWYHFNPYDTTPYTALVQDVPKSYKARRIIAKEDAGRQFLLSGVYNFVWEQMKCTFVPGYEYTYASCISLHDQSLNQVVAEIGSMSQTENYATVDLSQASDSITYTQASLILPPSVFKAIDQYRPVKIKTPDGKVRTLQMWLTSGNICTFISESLIFFAVSLAICEYVGTIAGIEEPLKVFMYGDDTEIPSWCFDSLSDIFSSFGWEVNAEKSFSQVGLWQYRESCGAEYLNGVPCDTSYFSRVSYACTAKDLPSLVDLQHRLYHLVDQGLVSWKAERWLDEFISALWPKMTHSDPAENPNSTDLWGYANNPRRKVPLAHFVPIEKTVRKTIGAYSALRCAWHTYSLEQREIQTNKFWHLHVDGRTRWIPVSRLERLDTVETVEQHALPSVLSSGQERVFPNWTAQEQREQYDLYCYYRFLQI